MFSVQISWFRLEKSQTATFIKIKNAEPLNNFEIYTLLLKSI